MNEARNVNFMEHCAFDGPYSNQYSNKESGKSNVFLLFGDRVQHTSDEAVCTNVFAAKYPRPLNKFDTWSILALFLEDHGL